MGTTIYFNKKQQNFEGVGCFAGRATSLFEDARREDILESLFKKERIGLNIIRIKIFPDIEEVILSKNITLNDDYFSLKTWEKLTEAEKKLKEEKETAEKEEEEAKNEDEKEKIRRKKEEIIKRKDKISQEKEWRAQLWIVLKAKEINSKIEVIASTWTPPLNMKIYEDIRGKGPRWYRPNRLKHECYEKFADYLIKTISFLSSKANINIKNISFQNEPEFPTPAWDGCVWFPWETARFIYIFQKKLGEKNIPIKIMFGETANPIVALFYSLGVRLCLLGMWLFGKKTDLHNVIFATHGYSFSTNGKVTYNTNFIFVNFLVKILPFCRKFLPTIVTEISSTYDYDPGIKNALSFAVSIYNFLELGVKSVVFWLGFLDGVSSEALILKEKNKSLGNSDSKRELSGTDSVKTDFKGNTEEKKLKNYTITKVSDVLQQYSSIKYFDRVLVKNKRSKLLIDPYINKVNDGNEIKIIIINPSSEPCQETIDLRNIGITDPSAWKYFLINKENHRRREGNPKVGDPVVIILNKTSKRKLTVRIPAASMFTLENKGSVILKDARKGFVKKFSFFTKHRIKHACDQDIQFPRLDNQWV